ncbi:MAG TPA: hypothetical protein PLE48_00965 [Thiobacillus sp.]|nr:MAG: hypothetical protein B7Y50_03690 [Hydrogenophilales bacterium 28-61-11]OYZ58905.1 MAG: hypothetical protein B7Y21_01020 [Hydrogenophilales bacterium 16-61-112]OZA46980.1 MAG: hypothetical protein B7X81_06150 [Hydrogenophilales bacterium 17-61-76]HQT30407.1 hypothetical protein [Thiobacillus sp.]HQT68981.1 hypothetical protein [Thiobacillus sp.]
MRFAALTLLAVWSVAASAADFSVDAETGLATWQIETGGIQLQLTQISPDQARAFYQARGFSAAMSERYAAECVFMTVVRNLGNTPIQHRLADWRYVVAGQAPRPIRSKAAWERIWKQHGVAEPARIAFAWAQFPATQTFSPGDWNQGMTAYRVARGASFDLHFAWRTDGKHHSDSLKQVRCADEES